MPPSGGRVGLVPLGTGAGRVERAKAAQRAAAAAAIPDYELTIASTFRSHGTIPELSESAAQSTHTLAQSDSAHSLLRGGGHAAAAKPPFQDLDLISIDRQRRPLLLCRREGEA